MSCSRSSPGCSWSSVCWVCWVICYSLLIGPSGLGGVDGLLADRTRLLRSPGKWLFAEVDVDRLLAHVRTDALAPLLDSETTVADTGEGGGDAELLVRVDVDRPRDECSGDAVDPSVVAGPDPAGEPVLAVIGLGDEVLLVGEGQDDRHRAEDLFPADRRRVVDAAEGGGQAVGRVRERRVLP